MTTYIVTAMNQSVAFLTIAEALDEARMHLEHDTKVEIAIKEMSREEYDRRWEHQGY